VDFYSRRGAEFQKTIRPAEQDRPDIVRQRAHRKADQGRIGASRLVFIDADSITTNMAPLRGQSAMTFLRIVIPLYLNL
jgi:hypothetical protein